MSMSFCILLEYLNVIEICVMKEKLLESIFLYLLKT